MCYFYCPKVYEYGVDDAVKDGILNDYKIVVHQLQLSKKHTITKHGSNGEWETSEVKEYQYWTDRLDNAVTGRDKQIVAIQRMKAMQMFPSKETYAKKLIGEQTDKTIVFANTKEQADNLSRFSYHSSNKNSEDNLDAFKTGDIMKLSCVEQLNEGVNIPSLKVGIIMHSYGNNRKAAQRIGRLLRLNPDDVATIHILCHENSVDKSWVTSALKGFDQSKIEWVKAKFYADSLEES